jgi:hypothetical protein
MQECRGGDGDHLKNVIFQVLMAAIDSQLSCEYICIPVNKLETFFL